MVNKNFLWLSIIYTLLIFFIYLIPFPNIIIPDFNLFQPDKLVHFIIYFIMLYLWLKSNSVKENKFRLKSLILVLFISFFIETLQGTSFIKKLDGNFSILILNLKNDKILSFRDRHGSNVLFYYNKKDLLLIFTKIKFLKKNFLIKMEPNRELIKTYIFKNYRYSYGTTETFFKDIFLFKNNSINLFIK